MKNNTQKKRSPFLVTLRILIIILAMVLLALLVFWTIPLTERGDRTAVSGSADWMAGLADDLPLSEIVLPGTHDSATRFVQLAFFSKCQGKDIAGQLEAGYRYLDIRLGVDGDQLKLMHGFTSCRTGPFPWSKALYLDAVLLQCTAFLEKHPAETIVFAVKQEHGDESVAEFQRILDSAVSKDASFWLLTDSIPLLSEARGKIVLLRRYEDEAGLGERAGIPLLWPNQNGHADTSRNIEMTDQGSYRLWVQDRYEYAAEDKWAAFTAGLLEKNVQEEDVAIHFLSTKGTFVYGHPYAFARKLDPMLLSLPQSGISGWVILDFGSASLAAHIYQANFT